MARRRVPTVGAGTLHPVQISPEIRHLEAKRAKKAAHRAYAPALRADREAEQIPRKEYRTTAASYKGAAGMIDQSLAQALAGLSTSGLDPKYAKQVREEFTARLGDTAASLPFLLGGAQEERNKSLLEARQQFLQDRATMQEHSAQALNQRLKELRGEGSSAIKEKEGDQKSANRSFQNALDVAESGYNEIVQAAKSGAKTSSGQPITVPQSKEEWLAFANQVAKHAEDADNVDAVKAVEALRKKLAIKQVVKAARLPFG